MWKKLFLQNFFCIANTSVFTHRLLHTTRTDKVEGQVLFLNDKCFFERRLECLHHLCITEIIHHPIDNVMISNKAQGTKDNDDGNILLDVWNRDVDTLACGGSCATAPDDHLDVHGRYTACSIQNGRTLGNPAVLGGLSLFENVDLVACTALLSNDHLFRSVD